MTNDRLYRSSTNKVLGGVAGGLAEYHQIDPVIVRLIFVLLTLFAGGGVLIYIVLWIVLPQQEIKTINNENVNSMEQEKTNQPTQQNEECCGHKHHGKLWGGVILITLGLLFILDSFVPGANFGDLWPIILVVIGAMMIYKHCNKPQKNN